MKILLLSIMIMTSFGVYANGNKMQVDKYETIRMELMAELTSENDTDRIQRLNALGAEEFKDIADEARLKAIKTNFNCGLKPCTTEQFYRIERSIEIRNLKSSL